MSPITTHILDLALGKPAISIAVVLEQAQNGKWRQIAEGKTNGKGRIATLLPDGHKLQKAIYRLTFELKEYFVKQKRKTFYPYVVIVFEIEDTKQHYHVPLLLSEFGYSTYRGS